MIYETWSREETFALGKKYGEQARSGQVWALAGDLGTGKTVFTQGFASGLGVDEDVSSPTFTILQVYESGRLPLYHFDVYRIGDPEEMYEIGIEEYFYGQGVCLEKDPEKGFDYRKITITGLGDYSKNDDNCT